MFIFGAMRTRHIYTSSLLNIVLGCSIFVPWTGSSKRCLVAWGHDVRVLRLNSSAVAGPLREDLNRVAYLMRLILADSCSLVSILVGGVCAHSGTGAVNLSVAPQVLSVLARPVIEAVSLCAVPVGAEHDAALEHELLRAAVPRVPPDGALAVRCVVPLRRLAHEAVWLRVQHLMIDSGE